MYSISEVSKITGISAYTLRFYEKIGVLPKPKRLDGREDGIRQYDDQELHFINFVHGLKQTGMKLKDIATFVEDGCFVTQKEPEREVRAVFLKRIEMLNSHIKKLEHQLTRLESVKNLALEKRNFYFCLLKEHGYGDEKNG